MKQKDAGSDQKESSNGFKPFRSAATEPQPKSTAKPTTSDHISKKDLFLMSFLGFLTGGILILGLLFFTGAITGNVVLDLSGEEEVVTEETGSPVIESPVENITEVVWEETTSIVEEPVVEPIVEEVVEESDPCGSGNEIVLTLGKIYAHNGRDVILKLAGDFAAQISVGGKKEFIDVGDTMDINGMAITMVDGNEASQTATITIACE